MSTRKNRRWTLGLAAIWIAACGAGEDDMAVSASGTAGAAQSVPAGAAITRASLRGSADAFLAAMKTTPPSTLLAPGARVTENGSPIALERSLLAGTRAYLYQVFFADPGAATAGVYGVADVGASPLIFSARLRVSSDGLQEVELITARPGEASIAMADALRTPHAMFGDAPLSGEPSSREALIAAAQAYFDGIESSDASKVPFDEKECNRVENGAQTTNNTSLGSPLLALSCAAGLPYLEYIEKVRDRRVSVVDVERGLVWAHAVFDIPGGTYRQKYPDGTVVERMQAPRSIVLAELFWVIEGKIRRIEVVMRNAPLGALSGW